MTEVRVVRLLSLISLAFLLAAGASAAVPSSEIEAFYRGSQLGRLSPQAVPGDEAGRRRLFDDLVFSRDAVGYRALPAEAVEADRAGARSLYERFQYAEGGAAADGALGSKGPLAASAERVSSQLALPPGSFGSAADGSANAQGAAASAAVNAAPSKRSPSWNFVAGGGFYKGYAGGASFGVFRRKPLVEGSKGTLGADVGLIYSRSGGEKNAQTLDLSKYEGFTGVDPYTGAIGEVYARQRGARVFEVAGGYYQSPTFKKRFSVDTGIRAALIDSNPNFDIIQRVQTPMYYYGLPTYYFQESKIATEPSPTGPRKFGPGYVVNAALNATLFKIPSVGVLGIRVEGARIAHLTDKRAGGSRLTFGVSLTK